MKKLLLIIACIFSLQTYSSSVGELLITNQYDTFFRKAYSLNPSIPKGVLESVAFSQSRFTHLGTTSQEPSCIGYPTAYGVMGLTENGQGYFRNNLVYVSQLSGYSIADIKSNPEKNILAYAAAFSNLQTQLFISGNDISLYQPIFIALSELPLTNNIQNDFAMNSHLYQLYWFMANGEFQDFYGFPDYQINLQTIFGSNYEVLSSSSITINSNTITNSTGAAYRSSGVSNTVMSPDYGPAIWDPTTCNYSSRNGTAITMVAIHDVEGSYAGCISWFKNCSASASAHYVVRSSDGQVTQMVYEADKAWHVGSENPYSLGIEHEGYASTGYNWYTTNMLTSSANLVRDMCTSNNINPLRCYFGPGCSGTTQQCQQGTCVKIKGHQMFPNQTHNDPGPYWNWDLFYKLLNNTPVVTTVTATSGTFYDTGGAAANYSDDERKLWLFQPSGGATSVSMSFTSFSLENNYDYMFIYDGNSTSSTLIGKYTSTVSPGTINSTGPNLLIEFRSDCATNAAGWAATYTSNAVPTSTTSTDNVVPTTSVSTVGTWQTANFTATFTDADNSGGSGLEKSYYQVIDYNGTEWRGNYTHGFFSDNFDVAIHPEWTQKVGTWAINTNALEQSDELSTAAANTNIYAALTQNLSNRYLYNFKGKLEGTGTNRRAGFHFFCDAPDSVNRGNSYFVWFRLDNQAVQIYKTSYSGGANVFGSPTYTAAVNLVAGQWYDFKVIYDRITGKMDVYKDNTVIATWTDPSPLSNGSHISFRSGNCKWSLDEIKVYRSRPTASVTVSVGSGNGNDARYQNPNPTQNACKVKSIVNDVAGNLSSIYYHDVNIDWTAPSNITTINDGKANDINAVTTSDSLSANWRSSTDPNSAIARYWYSIGTSPGAVNTLTWTSNWGDTAVTAKNLTLVNGTKYYFNVKSENGAGLFSSVISTNGQTVTVAIPTAPTTSISSTSTVCAGQPVALSDASSGGPTSWTWSMPGGSPSSATSQNISVTYTTSGVYTVSLTAANTTGTNTATKTITVSANPTINVSSSIASICAGQSSTLTASGATSYVWNPTTGLNSSTNASVISTPSSAIVYTVTGTTGSCVNTKTVSLNVSANPTVNVSSSSASICVGQSSTLTASGATSYVWNPTTGLNSSTNASVISTPASSIIYTVTGITGSCTNSQSVSLNVNANPTVNVSSSSASICAGQSSTLTASGAANYMWTPTTGLNNSTAASVISTPISNVVYTVTGTSGSCTNTNTVSLNVSPNPTVSVTASSATICVGQGESLTASGAGSFSWSPSASLSSSTGSMVIANPTTTTVYSVTGTSGNCSNNTVFTLTVNVCTGIENLSTENNISIHPNPFTDNLQISFSVSTQSLVDVMIFDVLGKEILKYSFKEINSFVPLDNLHLSNGVYWVKIKYDNQEHYKKLIKQ